MLRRGKTRLTVLAAICAGGILLPAGHAQALTTKQMMAPTSVCRGQLNTAASPTTQKYVMRCMINYARQRAGLHRLSYQTTLERSANRKSLDILRCQAFDHSACGRDFLYWIERVGYLVGCWRVGENLAWGNGSYGTVRSIMGSWLSSPGHRANILRRSYRQFGLGLRVGDFGSHRRAHVWTTHFGARSC